LGTNNRWIHPNGIDIYEGKIQMLINGQYEDGTFDERLPSGIWEYDPQSKSLSHKHALSISTSATNVDFGQVRLAEVGAMFNAKYYTRTTTNGNMLVGAKYYTTATTSLPVVGYDDANATKQKSGYIITPRFLSSSIQDAWKSVYITHKQLIDSADRISVKYRKTEQAPLEGTITWTGNSSFSTEVDISDYEIGDEVEITQGTGAGVSAHITSFQTIDTTTYIDIDVACPNNSGTAKARFQKWIKLGVDATGQDEDMHKFTLGKDATWIQLKIFMLFTGDTEVDRILINNTPQRLTD
jgi:hypothetical protein